VIVVKNGTTYKVSLSVIKAWAQENLVTNLDDFPVINGVAIPISQPCGMSTNGAVQRKYNISDFLYTTRENVLLADEFYDTITAVRGSFVVPGRKEWFGNVAYGRWQYNTGLTELQVDGSGVGFHTWDVVQAQGHDGLDNKINPATLDVGGGTDNNLFEWEVTATRADDNHVLIDGIDARVPCCKSIEEWVSTSDSEWHYSCPAMAITHANADGDALPVTTGVKTVNVTPTITRPGRKDWYPKSTIGAIPNTINHNWDTMYSGPVVVQFYLHNGAYSPHPSGNIIVNGTSIGTATQLYNNGNMSAQYTIQNVTIKQGTGNVGYVWGYNNLEVDFGSAVQFPTSTTYSEYVCDPDWDDGIQPCWWNSYEISVRAKIISLTYTTG
jgi:hypothetical protein